MSTNDYVKFVTQQFVKFIDQPKEVRKATKQQRKDEQAPLTNRWFGIMPLAVSLMFKKNKKRES
ncbi:YqzE family protein [Bacillus sp. JJ1566]|uniref:YqzE family protein n=1 Tax=Bacillus sp. JJ1566 TaxID=3122961 RepID=UPI003000DA76